MSDQMVAQVGATAAARALGDLRRRRRPTWPAMMAALGAGRHGGVHPADVAGAGIGADRIASC